MPEGREPGGDRRADQTLAAPTVGEVPCDLAEFLTANGWVTTHCRLRHVGHRNIGCGCDLCTGQHGRKLARRQERVQWRAARARLLADPDTDVGTIRGKAW